MTISLSRRLNIYNVLDYSVLINKYRNSLCGYSVHCSKE